MDFGSLLYASSPNSIHNMETLLSHSFDYLSSASPQKIRKGIRQVEGLLAQICLSKSTSPANKRHSMLALGTSPSTPSKKLGDIHQDPAFREFYKLQQGFQWNVAMRLIGCLERLLGKGSNGTNDLLIVQTLDLIQGVLLLHPPSRELFAREIHMNVCLDLSCVNVSLTTCRSSLTSSTLQAALQFNHPHSSPSSPPYSTIRRTLGHSKLAMACWSSHPSSKLEQPLEKSS